MNAKKPVTLSVTVKFSPEVSPQISAAAAGAKLPLATWARGALEREAGLDGAEADLTPAARPEPLTEDELTRRHGVRLLGEAVHLLREREGVPEDVIAALRDAAAAIVASLPRR